MALRLRDGKCSIASVADPAPIEGLEVLRHVENGDVEDVIWGRAALSRFLLSAAEHGRAIPLAAMIFHTLQRYIGVLIHRGLAYPVLRTCPDAPEGDGGATIFNL